MRRHRARGPGGGPTGPSAGFTLVEVLVTMALLGVVSAALLMSFARVGASEDFVRDRAQALDQLQVAMARVTKDLRQAEAIAPTSTSTAIDLATFSAGTAVAVRYAISDGALVRTSGGRSSVLASGLTATSAFGYSPTSEQAEVVAVTLEIAPRNRPDTEVRVVSEVRLRNREAQ